jgi:hypothetical protein
MVKDPALTTLEFYTLLTTAASCEKIIFIQCTEELQKNDGEQRVFAEVKILNNLIEHFLVMA